MLYWGFRRLGYVTRRERNGFLRDGINVIVGAHLLDGSLALALPRSTIVFNTEPVAHRRDDLDSLRPFAGRFPIWDYSARNADAIRAAIPGARVSVVEAGYSPESTHAVHLAESDKDIDVLFFGQSSAWRAPVLQALAAAQLAVRQLGSTYERELDPWLARSKLVLSLQYDPGTPFALGRVIRSLSSRCAVVVEHEPGGDIPADLVPGIALVPRDQIVDTCVTLIGDDAARRALAERGFECITRRDFSRALAAAIEAEPIFHAGRGGTVHDRH